MKAKLTITMFIICLFVGQGNAQLVFDDGGVHNIDWHIDIEEEYHVYVRNGTTLNLLEEGFIHFLYVEDSSVVNVSNVLRTGAVSMIAQDDSVINIYGGRITSILTALNRSTVNIYGGHIGFYINAGLDGVAYREIDTSVVTFYGHHFAIDGVDVAYGEINISVGENDSVSGFLTGILANGESIGGLPFQPNFYIYDNSRIVLAETAPEPATILLLGLGSLFLRKIRSK